jgi:fumarylacetoacetase
MAHDPLLDETHDRQLRSWVRDANGHADFPIQNLPFGVFSVRGGSIQAESTGCIAIGDHILSLRALAASGLLYGQALTACQAAAQPTLNRFLSLGAAPRTALRSAVSALLALGAPERFDLLHFVSTCDLHLPVRIGDYTDFYAGITHAENVGRLFRPENPLLPHYKWIPIGYHGRSSSVRPSGTPVRRPHGQHLPPGAADPVFEPTQRLDFELELGIWTGLDNQLGTPVPIDRAADHIAGFCLLNDWSARDLQAWEYKPLGPFLAKNFHTTISPWIITPEALAPFRCAQAARAPADPPILPYLYSAQDQASGALDLTLTASLSSAQMRDQGLPPCVVAQSNAQSLFWTPAQLFTHHASNGCNLLPGDLLGSGTISAPGPGGAGSLLEATHGGGKPVTLLTGERRTFLEDGDEVIFRAYASRPGFVSIGFGPCRAVILPAYG